jgi:hypothetical protein
MDEGIHTGAGDQTQSAAGGVSAEEATTRVILMQVFASAFVSTPPFFVRRTASGLDRVLHSDA